MKFYIYMTIVALVLLFTPDLHAQGGCVDSPEPPTPVLAVIGGGAILLGSAVSRWRVRKLAKRNAHRERSRL